MFGMIRRARKKKAKKEARKLEAAEKEKQRLIDFNKIEEGTVPTREDIKPIQDLAGQLSEEERARQQGTREQNKAEAMKDVTTPIVGLTPIQRQTMQESANKQLAGQLQNYSKMLSSSQGWRGVRGGKGQADINRQALNAQTQIQRDLNLQDADLSMQRLAAYLSSLEGKEAQELLRNQKYWDFVTGQQERRRAAQANRYFNQYYGTV